MTIISKAALAAELKVSKARVSQYLRSGLPVRQDGKIDREVALNWTALNLRSGARHDRGPARARELQEIPAEIVGDAEAARRAITGFGGSVLRYVAGTATDIGLPMQTVFVLVSELANALDDIADDQMRRLRVPGRVRLVSVAEAITPADWGDYAGRADEDCDLPAWQAHHTEVHAKLYPEIVFGDLAPADDLA